MTSHAVMTIFSATDKTSGVLGGISSKIGAFQAKARLAFANIIPGGKFLGSIAGQVAVGTLAVKGLTAAANGLKNTIASIPQFAANADAIGKQSQILGVGAEELQRYQYAAKMSNVPQERLAASFQLLNRSMGSGALFKSLEGMDKGLAGQIKQAKSTSEAFLIMTDAISKESNVAKRAAMVNAAFGKSGGALIPMMQGGAEAMREMMEAAPNVISNRTIAIATIFGDTMTHIKETVKSFTDTARSGILEAITPYVLAAKEWLDVNREFIKVKIQQFIQNAVNLIHKLIPLVVKAYNGIKDFIAAIKPFVVWVLENLPKIIPIVIGVVGAFMAFSAVKKVLDGIIGVIGVLQFLLTSGPIGIIFLIVSALIAGFIMLAQKVGGVRTALEVIGQTALAVGKLILKVLISPIVLAVNFIMDLVQGLLSLVGLIPGLGEKMGAANEWIQGLQDKMNSFAGLSDSDFTAVITPYRDAREEFLEKQKEAGDDTESITSSIMGKFDEMIKAQMGTTAAVEGLADDGSSTSPAALRWGKMGIDDYWETVRLGI